MRFLSIATFLVLGATHLTAQDNWPRFLGADGMSQGTGATSLNFDMQADLRFRVELPEGSSSPCIWGDRVFLTGEEDGELVMLALDRNSGATLWRHTAPATEDEFGHPDSGFAVPTPCTNGERVFFYFGNYGLVAYTVEGELVWEKKLPKPAAMFGIGASPILHQGILYLPRDGCPDAAIYAIEEESGEELFAIPRIGFSDSHCTPFIWENSTRTELVVASSGSVMSFDPESGEQYWRVDGLTPLVCTSPTADSETLYFAGWSTPGANATDRMLAGLEVPMELTEEEKTDPAALFKRLDLDGNGGISLEEMPTGRGKTSFGFLDQDGSGEVVESEWSFLMQMPQTGKNLLVAIRAGGEGDITETHVKWSVRRGIPYVSSPLLYDDHIYMLKAGGILSCIDAETGEPRFRRHRLDDGAEYYSTPLGVDGHVLLCSSNGTLFVLEAADEVKVVRRVELGDRVFASPAIVDGTIYLRTNSSLMAFGSSD